MTFLDLSRARAKPPRRKFNNTPVVADGIRFASKAECKVYGYLSALQRTGHISELEVHPRFPIVVNGVKICIYEADFRWTAGHDKVVADVKGGEATKTPLYKLKRKLMAAVHGITVTEITA